MIPFPLSRAGLSGGLLFLAATLPLHAQWKTETYVLREGWNAIYLHGDASWTTPSELFRDYPAVKEVWRWNPNPDAVQFTSSPSQPDPTSNEWTIWNRDDTGEQALSAMVGQSAYLVRSTGAATTSVLITQKPKPPAATWLVTGANFLGFPAETSTPPVFSAFFGSFPVAITAPAKVYKYTGGDLGAANPLQVVTTAEPVDRNAAYWFEASTVGDFTAPVKYELPGTDGLAFGRTGNLITLGITNRTSSEMTLSFSTENSEPAPTGQTGVNGPVPLTRRTFDTTTGSYVETPLTTGFSVSVPANGRMDVEFGIDRSQLTGSSAAHYASLLRVRDAGRFSNVLLPVSARIASPAGLWVGQAEVSSVVSNVAGSPGSTTGRSFPVRVILHVDGSNVTRLLSQAFYGTLAAAGHLQGVCTKESALLSSEKANALRLVSSQMPLDRAISGTGTFGVGSTLSHTISIPFDDPTNPFVHTYHPDHDNRDARLAPLAAGVESQNITRQVTFTFTAAPPDGSTITGWGTTIYGGTYAESITGLHKNPLTVGGTFMLRRVTEIAEITLE